MTLREEIRARRKELHNVPWEADDVEMALGWLDDFEDMLDNFEGMMNDIRQMVGEIQV